MLKAQESTKQQELKAKEAEFKAAAEKAAIVSGCSGVPFPWPMLEPASTVALTNGKQCVSVPTKVWDRSGLCSVMCMLLIWLLPRFLLLYLSHQL